MARKMYPEDFMEAPINAQVDLGDRGGLIRFKLVRDLMDWIDAEGEYWAFLRKKPSDVHMGHWNQSTRFFAYESGIRAQFDQYVLQWPTWVKNYKSAVVAAKETPENSSLKADADAILSRLVSKLENFRSQVETILKHELVDQVRHIWRGEPLSQRLKEFGEDQPIAAVYALDSHLVELQRTGDQRAEEPLGRTAAALSILNYDPAMVGAAQVAFGTAVETWTKELQSFKSIYEDLEQKFEGVTAKHDEAWTDWVEKVKQSSEMLKIEGESAKAAIGVQISDANKNLQNLTETYERHMQLAGPMSYWKGKAKIHEKRAKNLRLWAIGVGIAGVIIMLVAAQNLLPWHHPADAIPWRPIGLFLIVSTFALWMLRLVVKLLLSNIHLSVDAQERVVMINTFMALIRRPQSAEGLKKEDIAIVLAPIFRPSTTGVIKDDGGPTSLGEFLTRLPSKD